MAGDLLCRGLARVQSSTRRSPLRASHPAKPLRGHDGCRIGLLMPVVDLTERARHLRLLTCDVDGVLTDGKIYVDEDGRELKAYSSLDGLGIKMLERSGVTVAWITGSRSPSVAKRAANLGVEYVVQGAEDKFGAWEQLCASLTLHPEQCAHIGDDLPDLPIIVRCGFGATVPHAPEPLRRQAHYVTRADGGRGAVREVAELILAARGALQAMLRAYDVAESSS